MNNEIRVRVAFFVVGLRLLAGACSPGYFLSGTICTVLPANSYLISESKWGCDAGYTKNGTSTCSPCALNTYRDDTNVDVGCMPYIGIQFTSANARTCSPGQYYVITPTTPLKVSCAACSPSPVGKYYIRDAETSLTAALDRPDACVTRLCPIPSAAGVYTKGCGGTSPGAPELCGDVVPYSDEVGYGYYVQQTAPDARNCPVARCIMCEQIDDVYYQNLLCPVAGGTVRGACTPCQSVENGFNVLDRAHQKCDVVCSTGFYFEYTTRKCLPCKSQCADLVGYYKPMCDAPVKMPDRQTITHPTSGLVIGLSFYRNNLIDPPCVPCKSILNARPLPSIRGVKCQWACNAGFYFHEEQCLNCTLPSRACPIGQYIHAPCLVASGTVDVPACRLCNFTANAMRFTSNGGVRMDGCNFTCKTGFWKSSLQACEPASACYLREGYDYDSDRDECVRCESDMTNKAYPYGEMEPCAWFCVRGTHMDEQRQACLYCPRGTYSSKDFQSSTQCTQCPAGTYQPETGATSGCIKLPPNGIAIESAGEFQCNGGFSRNNGACVPCSSLALNMSHVSSVTFVTNACTIQRFTCMPGYYRSLAKFRCTSCDYATTPDEATTNAMLSVCKTECCEQSIACRVDGSCAPGFYEQSTAICASYDVKKCVRCDAVTCTSTTLFPVINTPCSPPHKTDTCTAACDGDNMIRVNATFCGCVPGFVVHSATQCLACPPGTYQRHTLCVGCDIDTFSAVGGATSCAACPAGTFATAIGSSACAHPIVSMDGRCPLGFFVDAVPNVLPMCQACPEGNYCDGATMTPCPWGTPPAPMLSYTISQCSVGVATCIRSARAVKQCPPNTTNINTRARSAAWCHPKPGYYGMRGKPASLCPVDFFCPLVALSPIPCPLINVSGALVRTFAVPGSSQCRPEMMPPCRKGWYLPWLQQFQECLPCPQGFYCNENRIHACVGGDGPAEASTESMCTFTSVIPGTCPDNMQMLSIVCRSIAGYFYAPYATPPRVMSCPANFFCPANVLYPTPCPPPTVACGIGETSVAVRCPAGSAQPLAACAPCAPMDNAYYTAVNSCARFCCNAGYYRVNSFESKCARSPDDCSPVVGAYYVPEYPACTERIQNCIKCPSIEGAASVAVAANKCLYTCKPGYAGEQCQACPHGTFANASLRCENCSFGYYAPMYAATACSACPRGTVGDGSGGCAICQSGKYFLASTSGAEACPNGFYRAREWSECQECAAGSVIVSSAGCIACPPATAQIGAACKPCMEYEEYMPYSGATACLQCTLEACGCRKGSCYTNGTCLPCNTTQALSCPPPSVLMFQNRCVCPALHYFSEELRLCVPCRECAPEADTTAMCDGWTTSDVTACKCGNASDDYLGFVC